MAAQDQQRQRVIIGCYLVRIGRRGGGPVGWRHHGGRDFAVTPGGVSTPLVDQPPGGHRDEPAPRMRGNARIGPLNHRCEQRLLDSVFAFVEAAVAADEHAKDLRRQFSQQVLSGDRRAGSERGHISFPDEYMTGRTSMAKYRASGHRAAISSARSGVSQSTVR
jgi:hypothetical protein